MTEAIERLMGPIWFFGVSLVLYLFHRLRAGRERQMAEMLHRERLSAIEKGVPYPELPPYPSEEVRIEMQNTHVTNPRRLLGAGALLIMIGAGTLASLIIHTAPDYQRHWPFGLIPMFAGAGLWLHYVLTKPR